MLGVVFAASRRRRSRALLGVLGVSLLTSLALVLLAVAGVGGGEALREGLLFTPAWAGWLCGAWLAQRETPPTPFTP